MTRQSCMFSALLLLWATASPAQTAAGEPAWCDEVVTLSTHDRTTTRYSLAYPQRGPAQAGRIAVVLLAGGGGHLDLDENGCARELRGNSLVRSLTHFHDAGFVTALVDAPSDHFGGDGLAGFRIEAEHAADLGKVIADVRARTSAPVWVIGTSRGTISAANAAARLAGTSAPDGVVLTSALTSGRVGGRKAWVANTVFDLPLEAVRMPVLVVGHAADQCARTPAHLMGDITARTASAREQVVTVSGGPGSSRSRDACAGRSPHGYLEQEAEVAAGIARFIRGGQY